MDQPRQQSSGGQGRQRSEIKAGEAGAAGAAGAATAGTAAKTGRKLVQGVATLDTSSEYSCAK